MLGAQFAILTPFMAIAAGLWVFAVLLWLILIYTFFAAVTVVEPKPSIVVAINGFWLLVAVATESLTVLGTLVAQTLGPVRPILFGALGAMFYIVFIALIVYRWIFLSMDNCKSIIANCICASPVTPAQTSFALPLIANCIRAHPSPIAYFSPSQIDYRKFHMRFAGDASISQCAWGYCSNCSVSVEPCKAVVDDSPPEIILLTSSK